MFHVKHFYLLHKSFITPLAIIKPATEGTKEILAGGRIFETGFSVEKRTFRFLSDFELYPRFFNSYRIVLARGQTH